MAFTAIDPGQMPSPDDVLARLEPGAGEPSTGFITKEDLRYAWTVFLSAHEHNGDLTAAVDAAITALTQRVQALESAGGSFTVVATNTGLSPTAPNGSISIALDTGQFFVRESGSWRALGLDVNGVTTKLTNLEARVTALETAP